MKAKTVAIGTGVAGLIAAGVVVATAKKAPSTQPPSGTTPTVTNYSLSLSTNQPSAPAGSTVQYIVSLKANGSPVAGNTVTLRDLTTNTSSATSTDANGNAQFDVVFPSQGNYTLQASAQVP